MNSKIILFLFFFCFIASIATIASTRSNPLESNLYILIESLQTIKPPLADGLISDIHSRALVKADAFDVSEIDTRFASEYHDLPPEIENKFRAIAFVKSVDFKTFIFEYKTPEGYLIEFVGAARRDGSLVQIAWIRCLSMGDVIKPITIVKGKKVRRGLYLDELSMVEESLRASAYNYLTTNFAQLIQNMNSILVTATQNSKVNKQSKKGLLVFFEDNY
jgi:hypothetical protein